MLEEYSGKFQFQFTPLREGRHPQNRNIIHCGNFNSRPSARGDLHRHLHQHLHRIFQFTPLREGRQAEGYAKEIDY